MSWTRCNDLGTFCQTVTAQQARREVRSARREWLRELHDDARKNPTRRFPAPPPRVLRTRLDAAAAAHGLRVESVTWRSGVQRVPDIVLESNDYVRTSRALPHVLDAIDPPPRSNSRVYEAIFLEVVDSRNVPYVATFDALRAHVMGGQWARAGDLYPFAHG
jgi:hypothetical protein